MDSASRRRSTLNALSSQLILPECCVVGHSFSLQGVRVSFGRPFTASGCRRRTLTRNSARLRNAIFPTKHEPGAKRAAILWRADVPIPRPPLVASTPDRTVIQQSGRSGRKTDSISDLRWRSIGLCSAARNAARQHPGGPAPSNPQNRKRRLRSLSPTLRR